MQNPDTLLPADFGLTKRKRVGRIIDDDEVNVRWSTPSMLFFHFLVFFSSDYCQRASYPVD